MTTTTMMMMITPHVLTKHIANKISLTVCVVRNNMKLNVLVKVKYSRVLDLAMKHMGT